MPCYCSINRDCQQFYGPYYKQSIEWGPKFGPWSEFGPLFNIGTILVPFWCVWSDFLCLYMGIREKEGKKEETGTLLSSSASQSFHRSKIHFQTSLKPLNFRTCNHCEYESTAKTTLNHLIFGHVTTVNTSLPQKLH